MKRAIIILVPALLLLCIKKYTIGLSVLILTVIAWSGEAFVTPPVNATKDIIKINAIFILGSKFNKWVCGIV